MKTFFKTLLKSLAVIILGAVGAGAVLYADSVCPKKQAEFNLKINKTVAKYVKTHSEDILKNIAQSENFAKAVKNVAVSEDDVRNMIQEHLGQQQNNNVAEENPQSDENSIFQSHWDEMKNSAVAPAVGPNDAKVTVVEFFDFACGHCKALAPVMSQLIKDNPDVRFIFNPLFFISEHSPYAAKVSLAAAKQGKFVEVFEGIMTLPEMNEDTINQILTDEGLNVDEIKNMIEEKEIRRGVQDIDALSQVLGINGVPMIIINGEQFGGRSIEDLQNKINSLK